MALTHSPSYLEKWYAEWMQGHTPGKDTFGIYLIYPMLTYLGYDRKVNRYRYRCKHLVESKNGKCSCSIYKHRPRYPCAEYGTGDVTRIRMGAGDDKPKNGKLYPGCVF
jgi:hypothetical protein